MHELGAATTVDYQAVDITALQSDFVFDVFGNLNGAALRRMARVRSCTTVPRPGTILRGLAANAGLGRHHLVIVKSRRADLETLARWVASGDVKPVTERVFSLEDAAQGHVHLESRRARGKVVIEVQS